MTYNGWTNQKTWLVNMWFNPESVDEIESIELQLEEELDSVRSMVPDHIVDLLGVNFVLDEINWNELKGHFEGCEGLNE